MARTLKADRRGSAAIEFGAAGSAFLLLLVFGFETSLQLAVGAALDRGARIASRIGVVGGIGGTPQEQSERIARLVVGAAPGLLTGNRLTVAVSSFPAVPIPAPGAPGTPGTGAPSQLTRYSLTYVQPILTGAEIVRELIGRGELVHTAVILVKNEPAAP